MLYRPHLAQAKIHEACDARFRTVCTGRRFGKTLCMAAEIMGDNEKIGNMMGEYLLKYFDAQLKAGETLTYLLFIGDSSTVSKQRTGGMMMRPRMPVTAKSSSAKNPQRPRSM